MAPRQRNSDSVPLQVATPGEARGDGHRSPFGTLVPSWVTGGVIGALGVAVGTWLLVFAWALAGWLTAVDGGIGGLLLFSTRVWLAGFGAGLRVGTTLVTLVPLGLTALASVALAIANRSAARSAVKSGVAADLPPWRLAVDTAGAAAATLVVLTVGAAFAATGPAQAARTFVGAVLVSVVGLLGAALGARWNPLDLLPGWARAAGTAVAMGLGILLVTSLAVLTVAFVAHWGQVQAISDQLALPPVAATVVVLGQWAFGPNLVLWAGSWSLGAGFTLGQGTLVSPTVTNVGLLPAFPVFGAVPPVGVADSGQLWWLLGGILAGAVPGWWMVRRYWRSAGAGGGARARIEIAALAGVVTGLSIAIVWVLLSLASVGDLGAERLVGLGPRMFELAVFSCGVLGLSGLMAGFGYGAWQLWGNEWLGRSDPVPEAGEEEPAE